MSSTGTIDSNTRRTTDCRVQAGASPSDYLRPSGPTTRALELLVNARGRRLIAGRADDRLTLEAERPAVLIADDVIVGA
jgi:hypothetical protein